MSGLRAIRVPFVAAAPAGARVRTRVRTSAQDAHVLAAVGAHLGAKAGQRSSCPPAVDWLRERPVLAVDLNHDHLAAWAVLPGGNPAGAPVSVPLMMAGLPASHRDGLLRDAISTLNRMAKRHGCRAVAIEDLDFADARAHGRESRTAGPRAASAAGPSAGSQAASRPPGSGTGSRRWPITRA